MDSKDVDRLINEMCSIVFALWMLLFVLSCNLSSIAGNIRKNTDELKRLNNTMINIQKEIHTENLKVK